MSTHFWPRGKLEQRISELLDELRGRPDHEQARGGLTVGELRQKLLLAQAQIAAGKKLIK